MGKIIKTFFVICISLILSEFLFGQSEYYRSGIVIADSLILANGVVLAKGDLAQIILSKSTEEGTFIKTKYDSALVYFRYVETLCWLTKDVDLSSEKSSQILKSDRWYIFVDVIDDVYKISDGINNHLIAKEKVLFDNKTFYNSILK